MTVARLFAAATFVAFPASAEPPSTDLAALSTASERPTECGGEDRARASLWERARIPGLDRFCDALMIGYASLGTNAAASMAAAANAETALPGRAAPLLLRARAELHLGKPADALADFERARKSSAEDPASPGALHDYAVANVRTGHYDGALSAFRALVPRTSLLGDARERVRVLVEAASLAMAAGPAHLGEAVGYLSEARLGEAFPELRDVVLGMLALAFDRQGRESEADGVTSDANGPWQLEAARALLAEGKPTKLPELLPGDLDAIIAELAETRDPDLARERWESFLAGPGKSGPFAARARAAEAAIAKRRSRSK